MPFTQSGIARLLITSSNTRIELGDIIFLVSSAISGGSQQRPNPYLALRQLN
jgi:hypothetical protein